jgi:hypothetical protein
MAILDWLGRVVGRDLDRRVSGAAGTAQGRYDSLSDDEPLLVNARLGDGQRGTLTVHAPSRQEHGGGGGDGRLTVDLGPGRDLRGGKLAVEAEVSGGARGLAALIVELSQPGGGDTYSVEAAPDEHGRARLRLSIELG